MTGNLAWTKSSYSGSEANCVEVARVPTWVKSSYSGSQANCVEVAGSPRTGVAVRDSKDPDGPKLAFTAAEWKTFVRRVKSGRYDSA